LEANKNNLKPLHSFLSVLQHPYEVSNDLKHYQDPAPLSNEPYQTFCGT